MNNYLAVFVGSRNNPRMTVWMTMSDTERKAKEQEGIAAWGAWMEKHKDVVVGEGGPLGKTKRVSGSGIADVSNEMGGFTVVRAESHEAAAKMFETHPHFTIFPGEAVEIMPVMPIPGR